MCGDFCFDQNDFIQAQISRQSNDINALRSAVTALCNSAYCYGDVGVPAVGLCDASLAIVRADALTQGDEIQEVLNAQLSFANPY